MNFDSGSNGWETKVISLATLKNIDLTAVTGIRFSHNFDYYEGRYDGVTEHAIYWDNFHGLVIEGSDSDLLNGATVTGGNLVFGAGFTNNTNHDEDFERSFSAVRDFEASQSLESVQEELVTQMIKEIVESIFNAAVANW